MSNLPSRFASKASTSSRSGNGRPAPELERLLQEAEQRLRAFSQAAARQDPAASQASWEALQATMEELGRSVHSFSPSPRFREELRQALLATHRRQTARRALFPEATAAQKREGRGALALLGLLLSLMMVAWLWQRRVGG